MARNTTDEKFSDIPNSLILLFFLIFNLLFYGRAIFNGFFFWDDISILIKASQKISNFTDPHLIHFQPVFNIIMSALWRLLGVNWPIYEELLIMIQSLNGFLLYLFFKENGYNISISLLSALFFCASYITAESAVWMIMLSQMLSLSFFLLSLVLLNRRLISLISLFLSFGSFGGGPILILPYILFIAIKKGKNAWIDILMAIFLLSLYMILRNNYLEFIPPTDYKIYQPIPWIKSIIPAIRQIIVINFFEWQVIPILSIFIIYLLTSCTLKNNYRHLIIEMIPPITIIIFYSGAAYLVRGYLTLRHLYIPFLAFLWLINSLINNLIFLKKSKWATILGVLSIISFIIMIYPHWRSTQIKILSNYELHAHKGRQFTEELMSILNAYKDLPLKQRVIFNTVLICELNCHETLSSYIPVLGYDINDFIFIADPHIGLTKPQPKDLLKDPVIRNNIIALQHWLNQSPGIEEYIKAFYVRHYPVETLMLKKS